MLQRTEAHKYLGSRIAADGNIDHEVTARINAAWMEWPAATGVLCNRNIHARLRSKTYQTVVRPVAMYATECWPVTKEAERRLDVMEMKMLRMTTGLTRLDRMCSMDVGRKFGMIQISKFGMIQISFKMRESRLR